MAYESISKRFPSIQICQIMLLHLSYVLESNHLVKGKQGLVYKISLKIKINASEHAVVLVFFCFVYSTLLISINVHYN